MWQFSSPRVVYGDDALESLSSLSRGRRVFLVTDKNLPFIDFVLKFLSEAEVEVFDGVTSEPDVAIAEQCAVAAREFESDLVVALGGGSVIDVAKYTRVGMEVDIPPDQIRMKTDLESAGFRKRAELVAIPTTSGSGADATLAAVFVKDGKKVSAIHPYLMPDVSILDFRIAEKIPKAIVATTGMDALAHGLEAYLNILANDFSDSVSLKAVELILSNLSDSYNGEADARGRMHVAATMGGIAINNAQVGLIHALAHAFGAVFKVNHGMSVALFTPYVLQFYLEKGVARLQELAKKLGFEGAERFIDAVYNLMSDINLPLKASEIVGESIFFEKLEELLNAVKGDFVIRFSPLKPSDEDIRSILERACWGNIK